jgi:hypothetical protein
MSQAIAGTLMFSAIAHVMASNPGLTMLVATSPDSFLCFSPDGNMPAELSADVDTDFVMKAVEACGEYPSLHWIDVDSTLYGIEFPVGLHFDANSFTNMLGSELANTQITYGYRSDISNDCDTVILPGVMSLSDLAALPKNLIDGNRFTAPDGLPELSMSEDDDEFIEGVDHDEHTLYSISLTLDEPTVDVSAHAFAQSINSPTVDQAAA